MIPSLVVSEIRSALFEYLASTFALADDDVRDALSDFLNDNADGIFRGPYLRVRTPYKVVDEHWRSPLDWLPVGFVPYLHQAQAFERLTTTDDHQPLPTLVTSGTGSGKTESFLYPVLDHCARQRAAGRGGIKALILYPMNALASDQAGRIAEIIHRESTLAGVTAGLYVGEQGRHDGMGPDHLIDRREVLRSDPPDVLLTNYKMLDFLLLRREDRDLWATNDPDSLRYVVLDEFHTYDGAQGTDVAMLLRRLGQTLRMAEPGRPLGSAVPVATSATLGSGPAAAVELQEFATKVFGIAFHDTVVTESRQSVDEACGQTDFFLPIPPVTDVLEAGEDADAVAAVFCTATDSDASYRARDFDDPVALGEVLLRHPLTRAVLAAVGERPRSWSDAVAEIITRAPESGKAAMTDPESVERALAQYLWLLSVARRKQGERLRPLFSIEVQLWVREVSRLLREVGDDPGFRWKDSAAVRDEEEQEEPKPELPAVYCRRCGLSGWMAVRSEIGDALLTSPAVIFNAAVDRRPTIRTLIRANPQDPTAQWYEPDRRRVGVDTAPGAVPVLVTPDERAAKANRCPACDELNAIRFLGLRVASLASVSINTLFGSTHVDGDERKLLAFTDSVQDASHRASFFAGRTHRINLRSVMARIIEAHGDLTMADLGDELAADPDTAEDRCGLVPPDLLRDPAVRTTWTDSPTAEGLERLRQRLGFEADIEFGLRARVGRTLELSGVAAATVDLIDDEGLVDLIGEDLRAIDGDVTDHALGGLDVYVRGLLERLRLRGGISHPFLAQYVADAGRLWFVWGGRPEGLPPFTPGQGRPLFYTASPKGEFDSLTALSTTHTWLVDWAIRTLDLAPATARDLNARTIRLLATESDTVVESSTRKGGTVYGLDPRSVRVWDVPHDDEPAMVRCSLCGSRHATPPSQIAGWDGTTCLRYRCPGTYEIAPPRPERYYRRLYRSGVTRRVVTGEHTGLLNRRQREDLEEAFKNATTPDAPNVITATPTLELGIDIGDLSAVMLASVPPKPANYVQRVGRAGRATGNALITTFVPADTHGLYYLADPEAMIAGEVRPPNCYLDAIETLQRQYVAYLIDRVADLDIDAPPLPQRVAEIMGGGLDEGGLLRRIVDASLLDSRHVDTFLPLFGDQLQLSTVERVRAFADGGIELSVKRVVETWQSHLRELGLRRDRLTRAIDKATEAGSAANDDAEIGALLGQRAVVIQLLREHRGEYTLTALERLGLLPNYTLIDDASRLEATLWSRTEDEVYETDVLEYDRPARLAVREFAPANSFYAGGHRHVIDALEVGPTSQPWYEDWRLCPDCGFGQPEATETPLPACPRCGTAAIGDTGASHQLLRLRTALSSSSEEEARVFDEDDDRKRERYDLITTVDVDPDQVSGAWTLEGRAFGAELAGQAHLRTLNLGFGERRGDKIDLAGEPHHITRFTLCRHCGSARDARDDRDGTRPERLHQGWCKVRSGVVKPQWDNVLLYHQLTTEAVRLLLPVSMFEVDERLASFKGALLLGLRHDFGGDPDHLEIARSEIPNRGGLGKRRFLVLYDNVPGGTGYLARLADPDRLRRILEAAREIIARCPCRSEGRPACHRCLLGVVDRHEYDLARRDLALELLDDILDDWAPEYVSTVANIDIGKVEESELERRFKVAVREWAGLVSNEDVTMLPLPGRDGHDAFELRINADGSTIRWRIDEQEGLSTTPNTVPDFVFRRMDDKAPDVAVYLDGFQFHASPEINNIADDAAKRAGVRSSGRFVWNLTWNDVEAFHKAVAAEPTREPPPRPLLTGQAKTVAQLTHTQRHGVLDAKVLHRNPVSLLLEYLAHPERADWERLALSAVAGAAGSVGGLQPIASDSLWPLLQAAARGETPALSNAESAVAQHARFETVNGLPIVLLLMADDPNAEWWTALSVIPDDPGSVEADSHRARWQDWLQWANVLQFLTGPGRDAVITGTSQAASVALDDLWIAAAAGRPSGEEPEPSAASAATTPVAAVDVNDDMLDELDLLDDTDVEALARRVLDMGAPDFVAGHETDDGELLEAAWPDQKAAVVPDSGEVPAIDGWQIRAASGWTADELVDALTEDD